MDFWFYDVDLNKHFCGVDCTAEEVLEAVEAVTGSKEVLMGVDDTRPFLRDLHCIQNFLQNSEFTIIPLEQYDGENYVIVTSGRNFYYVAGMGAELRINGLEGGTMRDYATIINANDVDILEEYCLNGVAPDMSLVYQIRDKFTEKFNVNVDELHVF